LRRAAEPDRHQLAAAQHLAHGGLAADGRSLLLVGPGAGGACFAPALYDATAGTPRQAAALAVPADPCGVRTAAASADGGTLAVQLLDAGTVHVFRRQGDRLVADGPPLRLPGRPGILYAPPGRSLALSPDGTALLAGAVGRDCRSLAAGVRCGAAHLYHRDPADGTWRPAATLPRPDTAGDAAHFGQSVLLLPDGAALVGGTGLTGGPGALHLFLPRPDGLAPVQTLLPPGPDPDDEFYAADLAASGDGAWVAVGQSQAVALYRRGPDGRLAPAARLEPPEERAGTFGEAVALDGTGATLLVGAPRTTCAAGAWCGAAYRYVRVDPAGTRWRLAGTLGPAGGERAETNFGHEAALDATGAVAAVEGEGVTLQRTR
jgi:hypothetical protein